MKTNENYINSICYNHIHIHIHIHSHSHIHIHNNQFVYIIHK